MKRTTNTRHPSSTSICTTRISCYYSIFRNKHFIVSIVWTFCRD